MSITETETIDFATIDNVTGDLWLSIADHLPWDDDERSHLLLLQDNLNAYLRFIESGELFRKLPQAVGRRIVVDLGGKFQLSEQAQVFFETARAAIEDAGFALQFRLINPN